MRRQDGCWTADIKVTLIFGPSCQGIEKRSSSGSTSSTRKPSMEKKQTIHGRDLVGIQGPGRYDLDGLDQTIIHMKDFPPIYKQKFMKLSRPGHGAVALLAAANQEETD